MLNLIAFAMLSGPTARAYVVPGFADFDPHQNFRSVGVFGSFGKADKLEERDHAGLLTFTLRKDAPSSSMVWPNYYGAKDLVLGSAKFGVTANEKHFEVLDWTTAKLSYTGDTQQHTDTYFSRAFPAVLYKTEETRFEWQFGAIHFDRAAYLTASGRAESAGPGQTLEKMSAPWVVLWNSVPLDGEIAPILIRFEHRPTRLQLGDSLKAEFKGPAGRIVVMPLYGIHRVTGPEVSSWNDSLPKQAGQDAQFWTQATTHFPIGTDETYRLDDVHRRVTITDRYRYETIADDWSTPSISIAPVPPITQMASANGYDVRWLSGQVKRSSVATFLGPYSYVKGSILRYSIPVPSARDNMPAPLTITGNLNTAGLTEKLDRMVADRPVNPTDTSDGGLDLQLKEYSQGYRLLSNSERSSIKPAIEAALDASYAPENLQTVTDPALGSDYVMCNKIWCAGEAYDREWYGGRQLDDTSEFGAWVDPSAPARHWKAIQGIYGYFRIYNDWAWSGTLSSLFAYALCGDGMNFAMEGMLGVARMARKQGDEELWRDASYRASKEALNTYASWFVADWLKSVNYVTWTDTGYDYAAKHGRYEIRRMAPADVQTGFGLDIFSDTTGIKVFRPGSFWHATAAFYWNNPSALRLYAETLYPKIYRWEFETMPKLYPGWDDKAAHNDFDNQMYGSNLTIAHLDARCNLFGASEPDLASLTTKLQSDIAPLYLLRQQQDLIEAGAPQFWAPVSQTTLKNASWDAEKRKLTAQMDVDVSGEGRLEWTWRGVNGVTPTPEPGPRPKLVLVNGKPVSYSGVAGGFYRAPVSLKAGSEVTFEVDYD
jgi:hypothetical protein